MEFKQIETQTKIRKILTDYIKVVSNAIQKKQGNDQYHCRQILMCALTIQNFGIPVQHTDLNLDQLILDCTVNDKYRSYECLAFMYELCPCDPSIMTKYDLIIQSKVFKK